MLRCFLDEVSRLPNRALGYKLSVGWFDKLSFPPGIAGLVKLSQN